MKKSLASLVVALLSFGIAFSAVLLLIAGCKPADGNVYTLYRSSPVQGYSQRIQMATFDADGPEYVNRGNCEIAADLFQAQPGVTVKYWCEKGRYRE